MTDRTLPVASVIAAGIGMGFAGDYLLRASGDPGLNLFLLFVGLAASVLIVAQSGESSLSKEAISWLGVGVLTCAGFLWRDSDLVRFPTFVAACTAFALPALHSGAAWVRRSGVLDVVEAGVGAGVHAVLGSARLISREHWTDVGTATTRGTAGTVGRTAVVGALLAFIPLIVFGALFMSADEVFAAIVEDFVRVDLDEFVSHFVTIAFLAWLTCGYLVGVSTGTRLESLRRLQPVRPALKVSEVATAVGLVDLLFLGFVFVQFRYLFGGVAWVEVTPGLTYATYARAGFFQLVVAVALAIPWLLGTHALLADRSVKTRAVYGGFAGIHLALLLVIVASAIQRMRVYQEAFGLTEARVVVSAVLVWLAVLVLWFGATVLSGHRERFAFGAIVTAFALVGALQFINPAGMVARNNLDRSTELGGVDAPYLSSLGADAVPLLAARLGELSDEAQCVIASRLLRDWGPEGKRDWRAFNWADRQARLAVNDRLGSLRALARPCRS